MPAFGIYDLFFAAGVPMVLLLVGFGLELALRRTVHSVQPRPQLQLIEGGAVSAAAAAIPQPQVSATG